MSNNISTCKSDDIYKKLYRDIVIIYSNKEFFNKYSWDHLELKIDANTTLQLSDSIQIMKKETVLAKFDLAVKLRKLLDSIVIQHFSKIIDFGSPWDIFSHPENYHVIPVVLEHYKEELIEVLKYLSEEQASELCDPLLAEQIITMI
ncbi:MAG: hypothetical protein HQL69_19325 [Magnetococcales bacterium]|nr:hypothetical protein [Magnetococcales bacterium]